MSSICGVAACPIYSTVDFLCVGISVSVPYPVQFFCESMAGGRVKQSPRTLQQLEALATSQLLLEIDLLYHPPRSHKKIERDTEWDTEIPTQRKSTVTDWLITTVLAHLGNKYKSQEQGASYQQDHPIEGSVYVVILPQSQLSHHQQHKDDTVDVHNGCYLLGVVEGTYLNLTSVEGHEHGYQLKQTLVGVGDGQPDDGIVGTDEDISSLQNTFTLQKVKERGSFISSYIEQNYQARSSLQL